MLFKFNSVNAIAFIALALVSQPLVWYLFYFSVKSGALAIERFLFCGKLFLHLSDRDLNRHLKIKTLQAK